MCINEKKKVYYVCTMAFAQSEFVFVLEKNHPMLRDEVNCEEINLHLYIFIFFRLYTFSFANISYAIQYSYGILKLVG